MTDRHGKARPLLIEFPFKVRTYDIDFAGHVNNGVYIRWLEDLRSEFLAVYYPFEQLIEGKVFPVLHSTHIVYKKPLMLTDAPVGRIWCAELGRATFTLDAEFEADGEIRATARQRGMLIQLENGKAARFPETVIDQFRQAKTPG
jgi:acyl-CoA thioester hydrolase